MTDTKWIAERDAEREEWNAALRSGDAGLIERTREKILNGIHTRIMNEDINYSRAGWQR